MIQAVRQVLSINMYCFMNLCQSVLTSLQDSLINIMQHQQVRLTERVLGLTPRFHPHLEHLQEW